MRALWLILLLAGCAGPVPMLERMQKAQSEGRDAANAAESPDSVCPANAADPACARIHAIRGRACLALARAEAAPGAACPPPSATARAHLDCAIESYARAGGASPAGSADAMNLSENAARAKYCAAGFRDAAAGVQLLREARGDLDRLPPQAERDLLNASVALALAKRATLTAAERCGAAREAARLATRGLEAGAREETARVLRATQEVARQEAATLGACTGG